MSLWGQSEDHLVHGSSMRASVLQPSLRFHVGSLVPMNPSALSFVVVFSESSFDPLDPQSPSSAVAISHICCFDGRRVESLRASESLSAINY